MTDSEESSSLKGLWRTAEDQRANLENSYRFNPTEFPSILSTTLATHIKAKGLIDRLHLFSLNENLEDVATGELKFMLIDFYLGDLYMKQNGDNRLRILESSRRSYRLYLTLCDAYELLSAPEKKLFEATVDSSPSPFFASTVDAAARREAKIAKYRQEKEMKAKIEYLSSRPDSDEDSLRALSIANLQFSVMQTFQALEGISLEMDILSRAPPPEIVAETRRQQQEEDERSRHRRENTDYDDRIDPSAILSRPNGPLLGSDGKPLRPFTLLDNRQRVQGGVFGSGHRLPTMTIDEYLEEEHKRGGVISGGGEASGIQPEPNEDDFDLADKETMKAREWDAFKEANAKGSGNTLNRG